MSDLKTRCLINASGAFLTECYSEELLSLEDEAIFKFIEDNKWQPVEDYSPVDIWNMIDDHALNLKRFVESELANANKTPDPIFLVKIKIQTGEYQKSSHILVEAPTATKAEHFAIYCESHEPEDLEWNYHHQASDMRDHFIYCANAQQVDPQDAGRIEKLLGSYKYNEDELLNSGNYALIFPQPEKTLSEQ